MPGAVLHEASATLLMPVVEVIGWPLSVMATVMMPSVLVAGVEVDVGDPAVGESRLTGRLGDVAESVEGISLFAFVRSLR